MNMNLTLNETRVIGCLLEKEIATPDQYPLSLNALTNACNQKSNRDPVLDLKEAEVQETVDGLIKKFLVSRASGYGSRVSKYQHRFCNTEFGELKLSPQAVAIICELFLRGPQTPGELRTRGERLCKFSGVEQVEAELEKLCARDEPLLVKLPREPGRRESRYAHLFSGEPAVSAHVSPQAVIPPGAKQDRLGELERQVAELRLEVDELRQKLASLLEN